MFKKSKERAQTGGGQQRDICPIKTIVMHEEKADGMKVEGQD